MRLLGAAGNPRAAAVLVVLGFLFLPVTAGAHALPQSSNPAPNADLPSAPQSVTIRFGESPDPRLSSIRVLDASGASRTTAPGSTVSGDPLSMTVPLGPLEAGVYTVAWRTVSAVDGHLASGTFAFGVGAVVPAVVPGGSTAAAPATSGEGGPSLDAILVRWLFLAGVILVLGVGVAELVVFRVPTATGASLVAVGLLAAAVGAAGILIAQATDAGIDSSQALASSLGATALTRLVPLVVASVGLALVWRWRQHTDRARTRRWAWLLVVGGSAGAMLADVLARHAAAGALPLLNAPVQAVHGIAAGVWIGGLTALVAGLRGAPVDVRGTLIRRFSRLATISLGAVVLTGLLRAVAELRSLQDLVDTDFGRLLLLKSALVAGLAVLGAVNHFRNVPRGGDAGASLRRIGTFELTVAAGVILATAALVNVAPPVELAADGASQGAGPAAVQVSGNDFGHSLRISLSILPGAVGFNAFQAAVTDFDSGAAVSASDVTLRFSLPSRPDLGGSTLQLVPQAAGGFSAQGANLSLGGSWSVTALINRGVASVEVPLTVRVHPPAEQVDVDSQPGTPTIYTVHLGAGRSVQVYLDPGTAGSNDVHSTFFDASGNELPVLGATITVTTANRASVPPATSQGTDEAGLLPVRMLEPGHFVGTAQLTAGSYGIEVAGPAPDGSPLDADLTVTVTP